MYSLPVHAITFEASVIGHSVVIGGINVTHIGSDNMFAEIVAIHTADFLIVLHCHNRIDNSLQTSLYKTTAGEIGASLDQSGNNVTKSAMFCYISTVRQPQHDTCCYFFFSTSQGATPWCLSVR